MPWFAAHIVMYFKRKQGPQRQFTVWENVHVIAAADADAAFARAELLGRRSEGTDRGTLREVTSSGEYPTTCVFAGVRKVVTGSHEGSDDHIGSDDEVTFSEFVLDSEDAVQQLAAGETVQLKYTDL